MTRSACLISMLLAMGVAGCDPCVESSDVRVVIDAPSGIPAGVTQLVVGVQIDTDPRTTTPPVILSKPLTSGSALVLIPSAPINGASYHIRVDVTTVGGTTTLTGSADAEVGAHACNHLTLTLAAPVDLGADDLTGDDLLGLDLTGVRDLTVPRDLEACTATTPDEDGDGRGDACDVCAADADPTGAIVDTDHDGVPDVCDPSQTTANHVLYFEPFNATPPWIDLLTVGGGSAQATLTATNASASSALDINTSENLSYEVLLETWITVSQVSSGVDAEVALVLSTDGAGDGFRCVLGWQSAGDPYLRVETSSGATMSTDPVAAGFPLGTPMRVRLSQKGNTIACVLGGGSGTSMASATTSSPIQGQLHPGIGVDFLQGTGSGTITASFSSLFAVTDP